MTENGPPQGHIKLARKAFDVVHGDPFWLESREFSRFEAWVDLIQLAAWKAYRHHTAHGTIELGRGEFVASRRYLATRWMWTEKRARVFCDILQNRAQLRAQRETQAGTVYLIVNYDTYQNTPVTKGPAEGQPKGQAGAQRGAQERSSKAIQAITTSPDSDEEIVCRHYVAVHPLRRPGDDARRVIRKALGTYTAAELCEAIDGNASDQWHVDKHKHEIEYVLRNNDHIDTFRAKSATAKAPAVDPATGLLTPEGAARLRSA